ncbi:hypothetical protein OIU76_014307 [Salix suchowensis]|uniref:Uncharacterized protein n=1 Tax=Salix suchowensis TaxID=1278906 RepID=A0ABQ9A0C8_9ROSI|nr:cyclin-related family protein [Salix suchowensis]KAJ6318926.1 hypothetical protein OIU76_014307 [Salix suchowensis]KAJ6318927.1 hypothetical protein OIU76_014307 [Salix suchowensis]KAJ6321408.1 hypothetical protein OIU77_011477 [Salix suchowensis]KAJ6321410.1 hypothetical protein OIU77_011477 [Salix suchowensis]
MDAFQQQQQHHGYMRPPPPPQPQPQQQQVPPPPADPYHYYHQYQQRPPLPPQPQGGTSWYPNPFQYNPPPPPPSHSPSPPPPQQWPPPPPPPSSSYPYPTHLPPQSHRFPPPRPLLPPPAQPHSQEWGNPNWEQQQAWEYPSGRNHVEDWAAKARAWAAAKNSALDDQHPQSQFTTGGRSEEQSWYYDQNLQTVDTHYQGVQQQPFPATTYQQFPVSAAPHQLPVAYPQENASFNMGQPSYVSDRPQPYPGGAATSNASPSVHQQEVPSSYSSVTGKEETGDPKEQLYRSMPLPISSAQEGQHHLPPSLSAIGRSVLTEQPFAYSNQVANPTADLSNQPLEFAPGFNCDHDAHAQSSYAAHHDSVGTVKGIGSAAPMPSISSWTPAVTTGVVYPPALPPGPQDPTIVPSSVSGHAAPPFGNFPGTSFQPPISPGGVPYGLGAGNALHHTAGFTDAYGVSNFSERPKKASVPNWLKEEIIKNASVMTRSSLEHPREEIESMEEEVVDKSFEKGNQAGSKSIGSPRSTEEEDDDEDYVEAARTAAINQEIKRILTEVLLKVTDELFDEIATKVLDEDDLIIEVEHQPVTSNQKVPSPSSQAISTPKASAKVLVPVKTKESENEDVNEKSSSSSPGNVLGLANYASDEDDEIESSSISNSRENRVAQLLAIPESAEDMTDAAENGNSQVELGKNSGVTNLEGDLSKTCTVGSDNKINGAFSELSEHAHSKVVSGVRHVEISVNGEKLLESNDKAVPKATIRENFIMKSERIGESVNVEKSVMDYSQARDTRVRPDQDSRHESRSSGSMPDEKGDDGHKKHDTKHSSKEKTDDLNGSKGKRRERKDKTGESAKESESRRRSSHPEVKEDGKDAEKLNRSSVKEDATRKRDHAKEKEEDRARHKPTSDSNKHKRTRSSSISGRGRNSKDNDSSDEASDDSKRKHSRKRRSSPSPVRSSRRYSYVRISFFLSYLLYLYFSTRFNTQIFLWYYCETTTVHHLMNMERVNNSLN